MHYSQNNSRPSLQGNGKPAGSHAGDSILASVDGKAGRQRATGHKQPALASAPGKRRVWIWALPLALGAMAAGGAVFWMQQPAELVASVPAAAARSVEQAAFVADADAVSAPADAKQEAMQMPEASTSQEQGAYIEDASALKSGASPFTALQAQANAPAEVASPFQALNGAAKPEGGSPVSQTQPAPRAVQVGGQAPKKAARSTGVAEATALALGSASAAKPTAPVRNSTVLARAESTHTESASKRTEPVTLLEAKGKAATVAAGSAAVSAAGPARTQVEAPAATSTVAAIKPEVATIAASAAQAAASAAVAEVPQALSSGDPLNSLLKAASNAAAAVTMQGMSRLTRTQAPQQAPTAGQPGTRATESAPVENAVSDGRKPAAAENAPAESRSADGGQAESAKAQSRKPNSKPEKAKASDPDVTLMRALMRHIETTSQ